jgi:hypothetical protein
MVAYAPIKLSTSKDGVTIDFFFISSSDYGTLVSILVGMAETMTSSMDQCTYFILARLLLSDSNIIAE